MVELKTEYMGLTLANPFVVASCSLVKSLDNIRACQEAGAGAVVLKSLFEEQIHLDASQLSNSPNGMWHTEGYDYLYNYKMDFSKTDYLRILADAKKNTEIPIIASINCSTPSGWMDYAQELEAAGADGIELNISYLSRNTKLMALDVEAQYLTIVEETKKRVTIPLAVKVGPYFSSMARMAAELTWRGANALVLFNRFYQFNIDIHQMKVAHGNQFSSSDETFQSLRWIALLAGNIDCSLAASTGIHTGEDAIKHLLAGADVVQLCSTLYQNGLSRIHEMNTELTEWMADHDFDSIDQFRGILSQKQSDTPEKFERQQYMKALVGIE